MTGRWHKRKFHQRKQFTVMDFVSDRQNEKHKVIQVYM